MNTRDIFRSLASAILWGVTGYILYGVITFNIYLDAFEQTKNGETMQVVLERFGSPSHIEPHSYSSGYDAGNRGICSETCALRFWYELPFTLGTSPLTIDFNADQKVIHKYEWNSP
jgi:hypothetical protein